MFEDLTNKLDTAFRKLRGAGKLTEKNISDSMREIRRILLEADVNYKVAKAFIAAVQEKAVGTEVLKSITPGQQIIKIVHDELVRLLGEKQSGLHFGGQYPSVIMLVGLQGSGKTTLAGKLGVHLRKQGKRPLLVAADVYRPAAIDQLKTVGAGIDMPVFEMGQNNPVQIAKAGVNEARKTGLDTLILDTAGRLHIDTDMMAELTEIQKAVKPSEILFVADGMTGQDAVNSAKTFLEALDFNGVVLTKMDGDSKGGAALSVRSVTGRPIKFISSGEKLDALEVFHPDRMASRILGMGDVVSLVEKAQEVVDEEKSVKLAEKLRKQTFTLEDFLDQLHQIKKMGPLDQLMGMMPGMNKVKGMQVDEKAMVRTEAMIQSMTRAERLKPQMINGSRRKRIAKGSGTTVQEVNRLLKQFKMMQKMMKQMSRLGGRNMMKRMPMGF